MKCMPVLGLRHGPQSEQHFFLKSQFYRCTDLHATYKLTPAGTLRFAQSPIWGPAIKHNGVMYVCMPVFIFTLSPHKLLMLEKK